MIHIGMASGRKWYSVERRGHRDGYVLKDVDGEICEDEARKGKEVNGEKYKAVPGNTEEKRTEGEKLGVQDLEVEKEKWIWEGLPKEIETDIDVDEVWKRWRIALPVS